MTVDLEAIRARADAATPGPWVTGDQWAHRGLHRWEVVISGSLPVVELAHTADGAADAEFIAHAREDIPALLAEIESLNAQLVDANSWRARWRVTS